MHTGSEKQGSAVYTYEKKRGPHPGPFLPPTHAASAAALVPGEGVVLTKQPAEELREQIS